MQEIMNPKDAKEKRKLPKNIRQIGEPGAGTKILIEDYAYTYLHQLAEENLTCMKTAVLVGKVDEECIYIQGALEADMGQDQKKWFSNEHWREIFRTIQDWFEGMDIVGWFLANPGFPVTLTEELRGLHERNFSGGNYVFFQMDVLENDELFYRRSEKGSEPHRGYYIYYEKNDRMQAYMSSRKGGAGIETEGGQKDRAATRFRSVMQEKKEQNAQKKTEALLYTACTFLIMVILVIGVTMINNYDRMENMENAIHQISESLDADPEEQTTESIEEIVLEENQRAAEKSEEIPSGPKEADTEPEKTSNEEDAESEQASSEEADAEPEKASEEEVQEVLSQAVTEPEQYQVQAGDTLLAICRQHYGDVSMLKDICEINGLENGDKIYIGQTIVLP